MCKPKIICVVGPTASGKTGYAIALAKKMNGEVVSCDSMQIYQQMTIGTAKPTKEEMQGIPHHMMDFVSPMTNYSVAEFVTDAKRSIDDILARGKVPILCGGTGLYIDSLLGGICFDDDVCDDAYRQELKTMAQQQGNEAVHALLKAADPKAAEEIHPNNVKRVIRTLEIIRTTGKTKEEYDRDSRRDPCYDAIIYGMEWKREELYRRIDLRVDKMIEQGLVQEVETLLKRGIPQDSTAMQAIGYKEMIAYLQGECTLDEAIEIIKRETRRYAKRQLTWFRRNKDIIWVAKADNSVGF